MDVRIRNSVIPLLNDYDADSKKKTGLSQLPGMASMPMA